ncbi:VOC family protein [Leptolyngbya ohadii]|uniref:VOC family protein n=1 Tax=Leptolyngbya ohadii TaxID=1962290 RepID=UPI00117B813E|nr:VOC family protein [Leptolyngbya ohadii]
MSCNTAFNLQLGELDFYQDVLEFEVINRSEVEGRLIWALLKQDDVHFMFLPAEPTEKDDRPALIYFCEDDAAIVQAALCAAGYSPDFFQEMIYEPGYELIPHPQEAAA